MGSPYGGSRREPIKKKPGAPKGNVNRRASAFLPPAKDTDERRAFLDALQAAEDTPTNDKRRILAELAFARVMSLAESVGLQKVLKALGTLDTHARTQHRLDGNDFATKREALKDSALAEIWKGVGQCEGCAEQVDQVLRALELGLLSMGGKQDVEWMERTNDAE